MSICVHKYIYICLCLYVWPSLCYYLLQKMTLKKMEVDDSTDNVGESCTSFVLRQNTESAVATDDESKQNMRLKSTCLLPPVDPRVNLSLDEAIEYEIKNGRKLDLNMDKRKLRRTVSNRLSAQRSRLKRAQYIHEMEQMINNSQRTISALAPQIESYREQRKLLLLQNDSLLKLMEITSNEAKIREMELERTQVEIYRLKELEKTINKNNQCLAPTSGPFLSLKPYPSLGFYGLHDLYKMEAGFGLQRKTGFRIKQQPADEWRIPVKNQDEAEVDQYINFEAVATTNP